MDASFAFLPDSVLITFTESDNSQSIMVKAPQGYDNGKIIKINETMNLFFQDKIDLDRCLVLLHDIATAPPTCGIFGTLVAFGPTWIITSILFALMGVGVGGNLPVDGALFLEFLPFESNKLLTLLSVWWPVGQLIAAIRESHS